MTPLTATRLRVWAAAIRDGGDPRLAGLARPLIALLDVRPRLVADNVKESTDVSIALLAGRLLMAGAWPA